MSEIKERQQKRIRAASRKKAARRELTAKSKFDFVTSSVAAESGAPKRLRVKSITRA